MPFAVIFAATVLGQRPLRLIVEIPHETLHPGLEPAPHGGGRGGPVASGPGLGEPLQGPRVDLAGAGAASLQRPEVAGGQRDLLVPLRCPGLLAIDRVVAALGLPLRVEVAALLLAGVGVRLQVVGPAIVGVDAVAGHPLGGGLVQLQGVILVPIGLDVRHLEDGLPQDLEVVGECGLPHLAARPGFDLRHRAASSGRISRRVREIRGPGPAGPRRKH